MGERLDEIQNAGYLNMSTMYEIAIAFQQDTSSN